MKTYKYILCFYVYCVYWSCILWCSSVNNPSFVYNGHPTTPLARRVSMNRTNGHEVIDEVITYMKGVAFKYFNS